MGLKPNLGPIFLQCFDTVGWVISPIKTRPDMTYNVFGGTLSLTQSINQSISLEEILSDEADQNLNITH